MVDWLPVKLNLNVDVKPSKEKIDKIVEALLTIISPYTERKGLIGDIYKHQRRVLALEFEKALEATKKENKLFEMPPPKFMLEYANKASREDIESELIAAWAQLLKEAGTQYSPNLLPYIDVISVLGPQEVRALGAIMKIHQQSFDSLTPEQKKFFGRNFYDLIEPNIEFPWKDIEGKILKLSDKKNLKNIQVIFDEIYNFIEKRTVGWKVYSLNFDNPNGLGFKRTIPFEEKRTTDILKYLNLISINTIGPPFIVDGTSLTLKTINATAFGMHFYITCIGD